MTYFATFDDKTGRHVSLIFFRLRSCLSGFKNTSMPMVDTRKTC